MLTFDEVGVLLDDIVDALPSDLYRELNGGISLSPDEKLHPESREPHGLYVMGEYHHDPRGLGRYILIYYGSFIRLYAHCLPAHWREELRKVVYHELTHHLESLAGEKDLEITDAINIAHYKRRFQKRSDK